MNPKTKKGLIIAGLSLDVLVTILLFVFSIVLLVNMPESKYLIDETTFLGWFQIQPVRILIIVVAPLVILLILNVYLSIMYIKKNGEEPKKAATLDDLSDEEKEALRKKILEEMLQKTSENK